MAWPGLWLAWALARCLISRSYRTSISDVSVSVYRVLGLARVGCVNVLSNSFRLDREYERDQRCDLFVVS